VDNCHNCFAIANEIETSSFVNNLYYASVDGVLPKGQIVVKGYGDVEVTDLVYVPEIGIIESSNPYMAKISIPDYVFNAKINEFSKFIVEIDYSNEGKRNVDAIQSAFKRKLFNKYIKSIITKGSVAAECLYDKGAGYISPTYKHIDSSMHHMDENPDITNLLNDREKEYSAKAEDIRNHIKNGNAINATVVEKLVVYDNLLSLIKDIRDAIQD